ncbi:hypothetical protein SAMN05216566_106171 [Aureimonas phyllosphaerae]|uniref:Uncharacterized protein n=1 Tax=Aureimonas phyllosphaerae TaxID=1166078 RepID=A0A7W6C1V1_9HYPH|nr:hypothetical protein [Aureimonas phyllosphaerae]MBB3960943.1 hypothetical protein [Aureimonas phyllosphaerae]SFF27697.1 hypothetical protein SAMN05216566_106171 [Aureimonas phyllosphaerae]
MTKAPNLPFILLVAGILVFGAAVPATVLLGL